MKHFMISLAIMLTISIGAIGRTAQKQTTIIKDTVSVVNDSVDEEDYKTINSSDLQDLKELDHISNDLDGLSELKQLGGMAIPIVAIIAVFGMPIFIILIALYFQNKNRQAKYRLVEKALENGKEIPKEFFEKKEENLSIQAKGIKNIFLGIGLGIFLWALTGEFGLGCIGFMVMFMGIGQVIIHRTHNTSNYDQPSKPNLTEKDNTPKESDDK